MSLSWCIFDSCYTYHFLVTAFTLNMKCICKLYELKKYILCGTSLNNVDNSWFNTEVSSEIFVFCLKSFHQQFKYKNILESNNFYCSKFSHLATVASNCSTLVLYRESYIRSEADSKEYFKSTDVLINNNQFERRLSLQGNLYMERLFLLRKPYLNKSLFGESF